MKKDWRRGKGNTIGKNVSHTGKECADTLWEEGAWLITGTMKQSSEQAGEWYEHVRRRGRDSGTPQMSIYSHTYPTSLSAG